MDILTFKGFVTFQDFIIELIFEKLCPATKRYNLQKRAILMGGGLLLDTSLGRIRGL